jgi:hypothetical protein
MILLSLHGQYRLKAIEESLLGLPLNFISLPMIPGHFGKENLV